MSTENQLTATTGKTERCNDAHTSLPFDDKPVRLLADEDGPEGKWHKDVPESMRTSPWLPMATTFVIGSLCINALSLRPFMRKRMAALGVLTAYQGWSQYKETVIATRLTTQYRIQDSLEKLPPLTPEFAKDLTFSDLVVGGSSDPERANAWRSIWLFMPNDMYNFPDEGLSGVRSLQRAVLTYKGRVENVVSAYSVRDRRRSNELGLRDRLAYEWRKSGSSVELRAALEDWLLLPVLSRSGEAFVDQDLGRCSAFFANLLESRQTAATYLRQERITDYIVKGAVFAAVLFPMRWVMWPAGVAGLCALAWSVPTQLRWVQNNQEHLNYSSPHAGALMNCLMLCLIKRIDTVQVLKQMVEGKGTKSSEHSAESDAAAGER